MTVRLTPRARRRAELVARWWNANRPNAAGAFERELRNAMDKLASHPHPGTRYAVVAEVVVYRLLLPKTQQHVYFSTDEQSGTRIILTVWGARRGHGPRL